MSRLLFLALTLCMGLTLVAQKTVSVRMQFLPLYQGKGLMLHVDGEPTSSSDIETFKCYLSAFKLVSNGEVTWTEPDSYHLLDAADSSTMGLVLHAPPQMEWDHVQFQIGIDSTTSVSGAFGGDLDPTKGMYWTWNSGYIDLKLEGHSPRSAGPKGEFTFHLGGYLPPFATVQTIALERCDGNEQHIVIDLDRFLDAIDLQDRHNVMSPGKAAYELSLSAATIFHCDDAE